MARKALIVGIDYYEHSCQLFGCVNDAHTVNSALERHSDGTQNFATKMLKGTGETSPVSRSDLRKSVVDLFSGDDEIAVLYFAGHGYIEQAGGYLICSDTTEGSDGLSLNEVVIMANRSKAKSRIIGGVSQSYKPVLRFSDILGDQKHAKGILSGQH